MGAHPHVPEVSHATEIAVFHACELEWTAADGMVSPAGEAVDTPWRSRQIDRRRRRRCCCWRVRCTICRIGRSGKTVVGGSGLGHCCTAESRVDCAERSGISKVCSQFIGFDWGLIRSVVV